MVAIYDRPCKFPPYFGAFTKSNVLPDVMVVIYILIRASAFSKFQSIMVQIAHLCKGLRCDTGTRAEMVVKIQCLVQHTLRCKILFESSFYLLPLRSCGISIQDDAFVVLRMRFFCGPLVIEKSANDTGEVIECALYEHKTTNMYIKRVRSVSVSSSIRYY